MFKFGIRAHKGILVIEAGTSGLRIAYFLRSLTATQLLDYSLIKLNPKEDSLGKITDSIHSFLKKTPFPVKETILSISGADSVAIKYCLLPALSRKEIRAAAIWQLKDEASFDLERAYCDWQVVKEVTDEEGAHKQGIIFAFARRETVDKYVSCLRQRGLNPSAIVTSVFNYADILKGLAENKAPTCEMVLEFEYLDSALSLYTDKKLHFSRYLPVSVEGFTRSLVGVLASDKGRIELTLSEAEEIRDNRGIPIDETGFIQDNLQATQVVSLMRPVLESLAREIRHSITYFSSDLGEQGPQIIYLAGLGASIKNLDVYLHKELGLPVERLAFPKAFDTGRIEPLKLAKEGAEIASCIGAALSVRGGIRLSVSASRMHRFKDSLTKRLMPPVLVAGALALSLMVVSLLMFPVYRWRLKTAKDYFKDKKQLLSFFEKTRPFKELFFQVSLQRVPAVALLNFISRSLPHTLQLNELELEEERGELILQGESRQDADVDVFLDRLKASGFFSSVTAQPSGKTVGKRIFNIKCGLRY